MRKVGGPWPSQGSVNVSPCGGHGQDLVVTATKRSEVLASIVASSQQPCPVRWVASDGCQLNLALVAAVAEHWLSHGAACLLTQEMPRLVQHLTKIFEHGHFIVDGKQQPEYEICTTFGLKPTSSCCWLNDKRGCGL